MPAPNFTQRTALYERMWREVTIDPKRKNDVEITLDRIVKNYANYQQVATVTGVPERIVAVIHSLECGLSFKGHLFNGDPLTKRTVNVPSGQPIEGEPPFTWVESAVAALEYDGFTDVKSWDVGTSLYELEGYNGWGYVPKPIFSPYLWSFTNFYKRGKYVADGKYDKNAVSEQCGAVPLLKGLIDRGW